MSEAATDTLSVVIERDLSHAPETVWRALTDANLIGDWLMETDFRPVVGHRFDLRADWGKVDCEVLAVEPPHRLAYTWDAEPLRTRVTWTLTPTSTGTRLRMEQTGFQRDQPRFYGGAKQGWPRVLDGLDLVLEGIAA